MKFANKLFFATTMALATIFTIFSIWMLSSYFSRTLNREMEQADEESRMFQLLFEMAYQSVSEYGEDYAIGSAIDSSASSIEKNGNHCFVWTKSENYYGDSAGTTKQTNTLRQMTGELNEKNNYACQIRQLGNPYYLLSVCEIQTNEQTVYLGISKDITTVYQDRQHLLNQYRLALVLLLLVGGTCIYLLSQYMTKPIRALDEVVGQIADGNFERRSNYQSNDEIGKLSVNFNHMADCLVEQMKEKESFTIAFAHELKTPLTSIIGYADMLNSISMSKEECQEAYYYIYTQGKRLENLSHKLLELTNMEQESLVTKVIHTEELEENLRATMYPIFTQKHRQGKVILEKGVVYGDKDLLLSVLYNLLDNAIKATREDGLISVEGNCIEGGYEIKVTDNGCGIPAEEIARITEAFYMVDKSRSRKEGGAGIGMTLCEKIINLHKGSMNINSTLGEGTVIQLFLPDKMRLK